MTIYKENVRIEDVSDCSIEKLESKVNQWLMMNIDKWIREIQYETKARKDGKVEFTLMIVYEESPGGIG